METITETNRLAGIDRSEQATASSAHARINIPLNLENWKHLTEETQLALQWFHQYILDAHMGWEAVSQAIAYDESTVFKILKGNYAGSWPNVVAKIRSYQKVIALKGTVTLAKFAENRVTKQVDWVLDYALGASKPVMLLGEAGVGKTYAVKHWAAENNHGRSVLIEALPIGGAKGLLRQIADKVGANKGMSTGPMLEAVVRAFNPTRILIVDEIQHHIPVSRGARPQALEMVRRIQDLSGCALAYIGTTRVEKDIQGIDYMFEQLLGRTGRPFYLPNDLQAEDVRPIVRQFIERPTVNFLELCTTFANDRALGRLRYLTDMLMFASRLASKRGDKLTEEYVLAAHQKREQKAQEYRRK